MSEPVKPRRAWVLDLHIEGDTRDDVENLLRSFLHDSLCRGSDYSVHGGGDAGGHYKLSHDPKQTHDGYFAALKEYLAARDNPSSGVPAEPDPDRSAGAPGEHQSYP